MTRDEIIKAIMKFDPDTVPGFLRMFTTEGLENYLKELTEEDREDELY